MNNHAEGTFEVKMQPQAFDENGVDSIGRMSLEKQFSGEIEGTSSGQMLALQSGDEGSAGYVAMEVVSGALHGASGTFALMHTGKMDRGAPTLKIEIVPDSGTGDLVGLTGKMSITIENGKQYYAFDYSLPSTD